MYNSKNNTINGAVQEENNRIIIEAKKRIAEVAKPEHIPGLSPIQQDYFYRMTQEPSASKRIDLVKQMKDELLQEKVKGLNGKLN